MPAPLSPRHSAADEDETGLMNAVDVFLACGGDEAEQAGHVTEYRGTGTILLSSCSSFRSAQPSDSHDGSAEEDDDQGFGAYAQANQSWAVPCVSIHVTYAHA